MNLIAKREHYGYLCYSTTPRCETIVRKAKFRDKNAAIESAKETPCICTPQFREYPWFVTQTNASILFTILRCNLHFAWLNKSSMTVNSLFASYLYWMCCFFFNRGKSIVSIGYKKIWSSMQLHAMNFTQECYHLTAFCYSNFSSVHVKNSEFGLAQLN